MGINKKVQSELININVRKKMCNLQMTLFFTVLQQNMLGSPLCS